MSRETAMALMSQSTPIQPPNANPLETASPESRDENTDALQANSPDENQPRQETSDASRLAIFAKKEAAIVKEREELKKLREDIQREKEEAEKYLSRGKQFDETFAKDKMAALRLIGLTDTDIINILSDTEEQKEPTPAEIARKAAQDEAQKLRDEIKREKEEAETRQNEAAITQLKSDISSTIKKDLEKYEYCAFEGPEAEAQAYEVISEHLKETGELLSVEQALDICEEYYEMRDKAMASLKKRQPKPVETQTEVTPASPVSNVPSQSAKPAPTLTNRLTPTATSPRHETREEKKQRLIKQLLAGG